MFRPVLSAWLASGTRRATFNASPSRWDNSCKAAVASSHPFDCDSVKYLSMLFPTSYSSELRHFGGRDRLDASFAGVQSVLGRSRVRRAGYPERAPTVSEPYRLCPGCGVRGNCNPCLAHFGLAPFGGSTRCCVPGSGPTTSRLTAPG